MAGREAAPLVVRESSLVVETLERVRVGLPFALRALDVDNHAVLSSKASHFANERYPRLAMSGGIARRKYRQRLHTRSSSLPVRVKSRSSLTIMNTRSV